MHAIKILHFPQAHGEFPFLDVFCPDSCSVMFSTTVSMFTGHQNVGWLRKLVLWNNSGQMRTSETASVKYCSWLKWTRGMNELFLSWWTYYSPYAGVRNPERANFLYSWSWHRASYFTLSLPECLMEFCKVTLTFESVDKILWCDHSNESFLQVLTNGAINLVRQWSLETW